MSQRTTLLCTLFSIALAMTLISNVALADPGTPPPPIWYSPTRLSPPPSLDHSSAPVSVMLELADASAANSAAGTANATGAVVPSGDVLEQALLPYLTALNATVLFRTNLAYHGLAVSVPANQLDQLRTLPNVVNVSVIPTKEPASSPTFQATIAHAKPVVNTVSSATGKGVRIGIIDRGIDYTHADFGGSGGYSTNNPAIIEPGSFPTAKVDGYDFAGDTYDASSTNTIPAPDPDPLECNSSDVRNGQGTHVAGLVAGAGVAADGTTYAGPYEATVDFSSLQVAPGIAPAAHIFAFKVFGCQGTTALLTQAIDRAIDPNQDGDPSDHLDVLLISIGTPFGSDDDPDAIAVNNAVRAGVTVVVAAGDATSTFYGVNSPASASLAIAVGATDASGAVAAFSARGPQRGNDLVKPDLVAPGVDIASAALASGTAAQTRTGTAVAAAQVAGAAALLHQIHRNWTPTQIRAALVGSTTAITGNPAGAGAGRLSLSDLDDMDVLIYGFEDQSTGLSFGAPWVDSAWTATRTLQLANMGDSTRVITLSATTVATETGVVMTFPTTPITIPAHGVAQAEVQMKIDPATLDFTADTATPLLQSGYPRNYLAEHAGSIEVNAVNNGHGTRVRPAHGAHFPSVDFYLDDQLLDDSLDSREVHRYTQTTPGGHIVKVRKPGASPRSTPLFSAPVTLADNHDYTLVLVGRSHALGIVVIDDTPTMRPAPDQALIHFVNANRTEAHWDIGPLDVYIDGVLRVSRLPVGATSAYLPIAAGTHEIRFLQSGRTSRAVSHKAVVVTPGTAILLGTGRHDDDDGEIDDCEQRGFVGATNVIEDRTVIARTPFQVFPIAASNSHAITPLNVKSNAQAFALGLHNIGARNTGLVSSQATPQTPLASAFELEATSPQIANLNEHSRGADIQYVGVTSSYSVTQSLTPYTFLYFGLASYGPWSTPNEVELRIYIDSNRDGHDDFVLTNTNTGVANLGSSTNGAPTDVFVSVLYPLNADGSAGAAYAYSFWGSFGATVPSTVNIAPFNSSVMFHVANVQDLALPIDAAGTKGPAPTSICYHVETRARDIGNFSQMVDRVPALNSTAIAGCGNRAGVLQYNIQDAAIAPVNTTNFIFGAPTFARPLFLDVDGGQITGAVKPAQLASRAATKLLVLHHHNAPFPQAEVVNVVASAEFSASAPSISLEPRSWFPVSTR